MQLNYIGNASVASSSGRTLPVIDPSDGQPFDELQRSNAADIDAAVRAARHCFDDGLAQGQRGRARPAALQAVAEDRRARRRTGAARAARLRQAGQAGARRRAGAGALLRVLCRRLRQAARRDHPLPGRLQRLHLARAARRHRPHHSVELPDADLRAQRGRRAGRGQRLRGQAGRGRLPVADPRGATGGRSRLSAGRDQHRHRLRPRGRRRAGAAPGHRPHQLHRQPEGRHADPAGGGRAALPGDAGARRQEPADRLRRCRPRRGDPGGDQRHRAERRPDLLGRLARADRAAPSTSRCSSAWARPSRRCASARRRWTSTSAR